MYAKAGGPPDNWMKFRVFLYGEEIEHCYEANEEEGWAKMFLEGEDGQDVARGIIEGPIEIRRVR